LGLGFRVSDFGFRVLGFRVLGFRVSGSGCRVPGLTIALKRITSSLRNFGMFESHLVLGFGFSRSVSRPRISAAGSRVSGSGFRHIFSGIGFQKSHIFGYRFRELYVVAGFRNYMARIMTMFSGKSGLARFPVPATHECCAEWPMAEFFERN